MFLLMQALRCLHTLFFVGGLEEMGGTKVIFEGSNCSWRSTGDLRRKMNNN